MLDFVTCESAVRSLPLTWAENLDFALNWRVNPDRLYMMLAYLDESGTHGADSPAVIVGGFAATVAQWSAYEDAIRSLFDQYGVKQFHSKKFRQRKGDFKEWPRKRRAEFHSQFLRISDENIGFGFAAILNPADYAEIYRAGDLPRKARPDTEYGLCLRVALWRAALFMHERRDDWPLRLFLEDGHKNVGDAIRVYHETKEEFGDDLFSGIAFETKDRCLPLAAADHFAHSLFRFSAGLTSGDPEQVFMPAGAAEPPYVVHKIQMRRVLVTRDGLADMRRRLGNKADPFDGRV